jgi:hypothetical protein
MTLPNRASLGTYGGALNDYSPVVDATTDRPASGTNNAYNDTAMLSNTAIRAWCKWTTNGTGVPALVSHWALWGTGVGVAPVPAYSGTVGVFTITWPVTVTDYITNAGSPGYNGAITLNLLGGWANAQGGTSAFYFRDVVITAANVATVYIGTSAGALNNPAALTLDTFVF